MKYFKYSEFDSPDLLGSGLKMDKVTLEKLDRCRGLADIPFIITSGVRTIAHNKKCGGVSDSSHLKGYAVDIRCSNSSDRFKIINSALEVGFTRIGISSNFIHLDYDPYKVSQVIWTY